VLNVDYFALDTGKSKICGDVDYESAIAKAGYITPVPGGGEFYLELKFFFFTGIYLSWSNDCVNALS
jgi:hypothetical protein